MRLQLFNVGEFNKNVPIVKENPQVTEEKIVTPLVEVLNEVTPTPKPESKDISKSLKQSLEDLFPEQQYDERNIQKAKEILGEKGKQLTGEQLRDVVTEVQYLVSTWLDDFEREIFDEMTLMELLHEKGGL